MSAYTPSNVKALNSKELLGNIWKELSLARKKQIILLNFSLILNGLAEVFSLIIFLPFISVLINPDNIIKSNYSRYIPNSLINNQSRLLIWITIIFLFSVISTASIRLFNLYLNCKISALIGTDLSSKTYKKNLLQQYHIHNQRNSSEIINALTRYTGDILIVINSYLLILSSSIIAISIIFSLLLINWQIGLISISSFGIIYLLLARYTKKIFHKNSVNSAKNSEKQIRSIQEGLGGIKDIILDGSHDFYLEKYRKSDKAIRISQANNQFLTFSPRFIIESLGLIIISLISITIALKDSKNAELVLPIIGTFALGAQKLIPSLQQIYAGWASIRACSSGVSILLKMMKQQTNNFSRISSRKSYKLKTSIQVKDLSFAYKIGSKKILRKVNFEITKGSKVGFVGKTGSGKSTIIDILLGLLKPTNGKILVDGNDLNSNSDSLKYFWGSSIAHVPQNIYLADCDISQNIAFGITRSRIDFDRVKKAAKLACLSEFIESCPRKYLTFVGERGIKLSGGQKQRIGLARAFYKGKKIIVLDEATSALDYLTESKVMDSINKLNKDFTVIIIAHRLTTLKNCDQIIELDNGSIKKISNRVDIQ